MDKKSGDGKVGKSANVALKRKLLSLLRKLGGILGGGGGGEVRYVGKPSATIFQEF